jgi:hypothetical protein
MDVNTFLIPRIVRSNISNTPNTTDNSPEAPRKKPLIKVESPSPRRTPFGLSFGATHFSPICPLNHFLLDFSGFFCVIYSLHICMAGASLIQ